MIVDNAQPERTEDVSEKFDRLANEFHAKFGAFPPGKDILFEPDYRMVLQRFFDYWCKNDALVADKVRLVEALKRVNHTLTVHGHIDKNTPLHNFIEQTLVRTVGEGGE